MASARPPGQGLGEEARARRALQPAPSCSRRKGSRVPPGATGPGRQRSRERRRRWWRWRTGQKATSEAGSSGSWRPLPLRRRRPSPDGMREGRPHRTDGPRLEAV